MDESDQVSQSSGAAPWGAVSLSAAIASLRSELLTAWTASLGDQLRFRPSPVELSLEVAVTSDKTVKGGVRWWLIEAGAETARQLTATHTVKLTLEPLLVGEDGQSVEFLVADHDDPRATGDVVGLSDRE